MMSESMPIDASGPDDQAATSPAPGSLAAAADQLRLALACETALARNGRVEDLTEAVRAKSITFAVFVEAMEAARARSGDCDEADRRALRALMAAADENALILDAVRLTVDDMAARLRAALTSAADPGLYGPRGHGPRHAMAAQYDTLI